MISFFKKIIYRKESSRLINGRINKTTVIAIKYTEKADQILICSGNFMRSSTPVEAFIYAPYKMDKIIATTPINPIKTWIDKEQ